MAVAQTKPGWFAIKNRHGMMFRAAARIALQQMRNQGGQDNAWRPGKACTS
jgi:hypothetical protein